MRSILIALALATVLSITCRALAEAHEPAPAAAPSYPHPDLPASDRVWAPFVLAFVVVMFITAACIGAYLHLEGPSELPPPAHSHDEPPGTSGHHGPSGTIEPAPEDELKHSNHHH